ncbi:MAG: cation diffusion facilitator family transporter [Gammaproteobacteria bacterium]
MLHTLQERKHEINKVTLWGVAVNVALSVTKLVGGVFGQSQALVADGLHSLSDLASDGMVLLAARHASEDADDEHPYGHARFETIATVGLAILLITVGLFIAYDAMQRLTRDGAIEIPAVYTLWIAAFSIFSKEALYHYTRIVANRINSSMLRANAWHHRSDAVSSIVVLIGIAGAQMNMPKLDAFAAIVVALMVIKIGYELGYSSVQELVDAALDPQVVENIRDRILSHEDVRELHMLRTRRMGHNALVDVHIMVAPKLSVSEGHHISEAVERTLIDEFEEINDVTVHIDPEDDEQEAHNRNLPSRSELIIALNREWQQVPELAGIDDITLHYLSGKISVEANLPLAGLDSLEQCTRIKQLFRDASMKVNSVGAAELSFH